MGARTSEPFFGGGSCDVTDNDFGECDLMRGKARRTWRMRLLNRLLERLNYPWCSVQKVVGSRAIHLIEMYGG